MARRKGSRGQASAAAIILIVFAIILVLIAIFAIIYFYGFSSYGSYTGRAVEKENGRINDYGKNYQYEVYCPPPYFRVGISCCLDENYNRICDTDEKKEENICYSPYIKKGDSCCLDENYNRRCDIDEDRERIASGYLDGSFDITDIDIYRDFVSIEIKNTGDEDYLIKEIDIDGCDEEDFDRLIEDGKREEFDIDCEDARDEESRDIEVEYMKSGGNETLRADGKIRY